MAQLVDALFIVQFFLFSFLCFPLLSSTSTHNFHFFSFLSFKSLTLITNKRQDIDVAMKGMKINFIPLVHCKTLSQYPLYDITVILFICAIFSMNSVSVSFFLLLRTLPHEHFYSSQCFCFICCVLLVRKH